MKAIGHFPWSAIGHPVYHVSKIVAIVLCVVVIWSVVLTWSVLDEAWRAARASAAQDE